MIFHAQSRGYLVIQEDITYAGLSNGSLTADEVTGQATLSVVGGLIAKGQGSLDFNEATGALPKPAV